MASYSEKKVVVNYPVASRRRRLVREDSDNASGADTGEEGKANSNGNVADHVPLVFELLQVGTRVRGIPGRLLATALCCVPRALLTASRA